jgi:hypothetical protein
MVILSILAFSIILYGLFGIQIKNTEYTFYGEGSIQDGQGNIIYFKRQIEFTAVGSFSAENKIHVKITLYDCNSNQLLKYMREVGFTEAFDYYPTISSKVNALVPLTRTIDGNYTGESDLLWHTSQNTYMYPVVPAPEGTLVYNDATAIINNTRAVLFISPTSDFLAIQSSHTMEQLTWVIIGLTVIMLFPVVTSFMPEKQEINIRINGVNLSKLIAEENEREEKEKATQKKRRFWNRRNRRK